MNESQDYETMRAGRPLRLVSECYVPDSVRHLFQTKNGVRHASIKQGSVTWHEMRCGHVTSTEAYDIVYGTANAYRAIQDKKLIHTKKMLSRKNADATRVRETVHDWSNEFACEVGPSWPPVAFGHKYEPVAAQMYTDWFQTTLMAPGIVEHPQHTWLTASPDRIDLRNGVLLEIKCAFTRVLPSREVPARHWVQMQIAMACCGMNECCYVEFSLNNSTRTQEHVSPDDTPMLFVRRVEFDPTWFDDHVDTLYAFYKETMQGMRRRPRPRTVLKARLDHDRQVFTSQTESHRFTARYIPAPVETVDMPLEIPGEMQAQAPVLEVPDCVSAKAWKPSRFLDEMFNHGHAEQIDLDPLPG